MSSYALISENEALKKRVKELEQQLGDLNKIKARAINEVADALYCLNVSDGHGDEDQFAINYFKSYANKLENQND